MDDWKRICVLLCLVGFFKSIRPTEPFLTQFLMGPYYNLTSEELSSQVYPIATYSYLCVLFVILLITDYVRYKPVVLLEATSIVGTYALLVWGRTLLATQFVEFLYAIGTSSEIAYYTYIYAKVSENEFQKVSSFTRAAVLAGFFLSGVIAQTLVSTKTIEGYMELNYITLGTACVATLFAVFLPPVKRSIYFHQDEPTVTLPPVEKKIPERLDVGTGPPSPPYANGNTVTSASASDRDSIAVSELRFITAGAMKRTFVRKLKVGFWTIRRDVKESYSNSSVFKWSLWWAFGTCLNFQIGNYIQPMWEEIYSFKENAIYNGAVESISTLFGALAALAVGYIHMDWSRYGEVILTVVSMLDGACLFIVAYTSNIWVAYVCYTIFRASYQMVITIASYQVAKDIRADSYGLIFGCNTFIALVIQTVLVLIVADERGLALLPRSQFAVYASFSLVLGCVFLLTSVVQLWKNRSAYSLGANANPS